MTEFGPEIAKLAKGLDWLAVHWLTDEAFQSVKPRLLTATHDRSALLVKLPPHSFIVMLAAVKTHAHGIRPALPIVLCWKAGEDHSLRLPQGLQKLATAVRMACGSSSTQHGLSEVKGFDGWIDAIKSKGWTCDTWESAYASLASALIAARHGQSIDIRVAATAARRDSSFCQVACVKEKLVAFEQLGVTTVFLASTQDENGSPLEVNERLKVESFASSGSVVVDLLPMLIQCVVKPSPESPIGWRKGYFEMLSRLGHGAEADANEFYTSSLRSTLADGLRSRAVREPRLMSFLESHTQVGLICIDSRKFTLHMLLHEVFRPRHWIILHKGPEDGLGLRDWCKVHVAFDVHWICMDAGGWESRLSQLIDGIPAVDGPVRWIADVTGGQTSTRFKLYHECVQRGIPVLTVSSVWTDHLKVGTEYLERLDHHNS